MINIYTFCFNNPEFLELQHAAFKKHLKEEHRLICINNASNKEDFNAILDVARRLNIYNLYVDHPDHSQAGRSHQRALNEAWKFMDHSNIIIIVDHDMFPIRDIKLYKDYDIASVMQGRGEHIKYFHPGIMIIHPSLKDRDQVDFKGEKIDGLDCDSGGNWHHYLTSHPDLKIKELSMVNISDEQDNMNVIPPLEGYNQNNPMQICEDFLLHYRDGSNWSHDPADVFNRKKEHLRQTLNNYM